MKKIFTLASALFLTVAVFAADRRPSVTVTSSKKYEIVIDGKTYSSNGGNSINIANLQSGRHNVKVFELNKFFFLKNKKMVSSSSFQLKNQDIQISVDRGGQVQITEMGYDRGKDWKDDHKAPTRKNHGHRF